MGVYHIPKKPGKFGQSVNGKIDFVSPNGNFFGKKNGRQKFANGISAWKMRVPFARFY